METENHNEIDQIKLSYINYVATKPFRDNARLIVYGILGLACARFLASVFTKPLRIRRILFRLPLIPFVYLLSILVSKLIGKELAKKEILS